jgi:dihydrofolate reductase
MAVEQVPAEWRRELSVTVSIIAAMSRNRIIGAGGAIPWDIPADMRRFRELTLGHSIIMGRKTFESIGHPLPGRHNIVVTRQPGYCSEGTLVAATLEEALHLAEGENEIFICGGGDLYGQALPLADRIYLTVIDLDIEGDTRFPVIQQDAFIEISRERLAVDPPADFIVLERTAADTVCSG